MLIETFQKTPDLVKKLRELATEWRFWSADEVLSSLRDPVNRLMYAVDQPGGAWKGLCFFREVGDDWELLYLFVHPDGRRQGTGRILLQAWMDRARDIPVKDLWLEVRVSNHPAISLYESLGFEQSGMRKQYFSDGEDALLMKFSPESE